MSEIAIRAEGLSKLFHIGQSRPFRSLRDSLGRMLGLGKHDIPAIPGATNSDSSTNGDETIWALKDVSFEVKRGEVVGIIGRNGAGKSTLLKILSRITEPTEGHADIHGRVGSLLEVGTGFHPELSGRENIFLNGAILGMARTEIKKKFDEIVDFAEIAKFIDTPVKHYSSGMYTRLAFAVAAHLEPEILIVDEVLAVGDAQFQKKCLGKMGDVAKQGRTVLFVSHNLTAISSLCANSIWLDLGRIKRGGSCSEVVSAYLQSHDSVETARVWEDPATAPGDDRVRFHRIQVEPASNAPDGLITVEVPIRLRFEYWNMANGARLHLSVLVSTSEGVCVFNTGSRPDDLPAGLISESFEIPGGFLNDGLHSVRVLVVRDESVVLLNLDDVAQFDVKDVKREFAWQGKWIGATRPSFEWTKSVMQSDPDCEIVSQGKPFTDGR